MTPRTSPGERRQELWPPGQAVYGRQVLRWALSRPSTVVLLQLFEKLDALGGRGDLLLQPLVLLLSSQFWHFHLLLLLLLLLLLFGP